MKFILLALYFNCNFASRPPTPVWLGEFGSLEACAAAANKINRMASEGKARDPIAFCAGKG